MLTRLTRRVSTLLAMAIALCSATVAQHTFRGGINGVVTDQSGAVISGAKVDVTNEETNVTLSTLSSSAGEYAFPELNIGKYDIVATASGFQSVKVKGVSVSAGMIFTQAMKLTVASSAETIEVSADAYTLDTTTTTQTTIIDAQAVDDAPLNGRDFTQLATLTPGFANSGAGGYGSLNGTRANQINWQIDGVDNNDIWHNIPAVNQGGVSGIAGIILPIDSVEQFSIQTNASADTGRNPGGTATLGLKGGTNHLHGSAYYYNRNELFGTKSPFTPTKQKVRDYNAGGSVGGPILKDKLFYFANYEQQRFVIGVPQQATEPTGLWQSYATDIVKSNGGTISPISSGLLTMLWPSYALTSSAETSIPVVGNYVSPDPEFGYSYNGVAKVDYTINSNNSISAHWFGGQGNQVAPVGSALLPYYEVAPIHVQNWQLTYNRTFSPSLTNQVVAGVNYFNQIFNDDKTGYDVTTLGLIDGSPFKNAPKLQISGFDSTGRTPPEGRNDITGQISDNVSWVKGKHQARFGMEFRRVSLNEFYHRNAQGNFKFNGARGNWDLSKSVLAGSITDGAVKARLLALADFLAGDVNTSTITLGNPERLVYVHTFAGFGQDSYQITKSLNLNFGLRWDFEGPLHDSKKDLSVFRPELGGIVFQGDKISSVYDPKYTNFSPRVGISYQAKQHTVVRAGSGIYYDTPNINPFLDNRPGNNAPNGLESNPAGASPVFAISKNQYTWQPGVDPFGSATAPTCLPDSPCGVFSVQKKFQPSYNINYNFQIEQSVGSNVIAQLGYVGSEGRHLLSIIDLNQSMPNGEGVDQTSRPYYSAFPVYGNINEIQSIGNSNYNSLQATLRATNFHHLSVQGAYTWSHAFDDVTAYRGALPQDSTNFKGDYGQSDFDTRHTFVGEVSYDVPGFAEHKAITGGWQLNSVWAFHTGLPFTVLTDDQTDNTGEGNQRANQVLANPYSGFKKQKVGADWLNQDAFADPADGTWGTSRRNAYASPGFGDVDFSVFKNTKIGERVNTQFRVEFYNIFNRTNFAPPLGGASGSYNPNQATISTMQLYDTIGDFNGAPGIGAGEPFNTQLALKVTF
ncbi:TonB-dependent receptor [Occallatibacter savannae]|uniref:TonB-dependent receptor n=1 Tax=Occallatibacter savannae TaxID=1002691 RepID=UPI000D696CFF|nr:TonB-dependent receptor [Occallatibacter savannae]